MKYSKVPQCMSSVHAQVCRECFCFTVCLEYALKVEFTNTTLILQVPVLKMVWVLFKVKKIVLLTVYEIKMCGAHLINLDCKALVFFTYLFFFLKIIFLLSVIYWLNCFRCNGILLPVGRPSISGLIHVLSFRINWWRRKKTVFCPPFMYPSVFSIPSIDKWYPFSQS